ncbi:MAG TPA: FkbM family methyltransferase [Chthoniobacter sp.]|jgi:FkbM family methyltransferase
MTNSLTNGRHDCFPSLVSDTAHHPSPLLLRLQRDPRVNTMVKKLGLHRVADVLLRFRPLVKRTPAGLEYKVRSVASIVAANEIFETPMYRRPLQGESIRSFVDLGCNVGYFPLLLSDLTGSKDLQGLMIDGNQQVLDEALDHVTANDLKNVAVVLGLAGFDDEKKEADFLVNPSSHIASTATGKLNPDVPSAGRSVKVTVPCVNVEQAWTSRFGDVPIDLLKVDIEGMELELFRNAPALLARSQRLLFEWHKWQVSIADCRAVLNAAGFDDPATMWEDAQHGLAYSRRRAA